MFIFLVLEGCLQPVENVKQNSVWVMYFLHLYKKKLRQALFLYDFEKKLSMRQSSEPVTEIKSLFMQNDKVTFSFFRGRFVAPVHYHNVWETQ